MANHKQLFLLNCWLTVPRILLPAWINGSIPYLDEGCAEVVGRRLQGHHVSPAFFPLGRDMSPKIAQTELLAKLLIDFLIIL